MNHSRPPSNPPRLRQVNDATGRLLRRALSQSHPPTTYRDVEDGVQRIEQILARRSRGSQFLVAFALAGALAVVLLLIRDRHGWGPASRPSTPSVAASAVAQIGTEPSEDGVPIGDHASHRLGDGTVVSVPAEGHAVISRPAQTRTVVDLERGTVELAVSPRAPGEQFEVTAGRFRFRVVGTRFRVAREATGLSLSVAEGRVEVVEKDQVLQVVEAGGTWREEKSEPEKSEPGRQLGQAATQPGRATNGPTVASSVASDPDCLAFARSGEHVSALECFKRQARGEGVAAEIGLYESARIEHAIKGDPRRALETLRAYRERFPHGALSVEVALKSVQILTELGREGEALELSETLLRNGQRTAPEAELRWLRGKLFKRQGRLDAAASEFSRAADSSGALRERAKLERADCLEKLGQREQARIEYQTLSETGNARTRDEARRRLARLGVEEASNNELE